jgi:hypothetical protein
MTAEWFAAGSAEIEMISSQAQCPDRAGASDIHDNDLGPIDTNGTQKVIGWLLRAQGVGRAHDRQNEQALADLEHRRRQLAISFPLKIDRELALGDQNVDEDADIEDADFFHCPEILKFLLRLAGNAA